MGAKTHTSAVVVIPPEGCWQQIQAIRRKYDRQVRRWMPHVTLVYPFRPPEQFDAVAETLRGVCAEIEPFEVRLSELNHFEHGRGRYTLWLAPEPGQELVRLQRVVESAVPDCNDTSRYPGGFTPHLSVGQVRGREVMVRIKQALQADWRPVSFRVRQVSLIRRNEPPDDVFRVDRVIELKK